MIRSIARLACTASLALLAPAADAQSRTCTAAGTIVTDPGGGHLIGMWRDPTNGSLHAAVAAPPEVRVSQIALAFPSNHELTATLPSGASALRAWRGASGDRWIAWRSARADRLQLSRAGTIHLGHLELGPVHDMPFARPPRAGEERMLEPLDDPSDSRIAGLMEFVHATGGGESPVTVLLDTTASAASLIPLGAHGVLNGGANLQDTGWHSSAGALLLSGENGIGAAIVRDQDEYEQLGPHGPFNLGRFSVDRLSRSHGTGFPRLVMFASGNGLALWTPQASNGETTLALDAQPIDARGHATGEPVVHTLSIAPRDGLGPPALRDVAQVGDEVWVTVITAGDAASGVRQSTLVRLDQHGARVASPLTVAIDAPRILDAGNGAAILWSEQDANALLIRCR